MKNAFLTILLSGTVLPILRLEGVLQEGIECPLLVTEHATYSLTDNTAGFNPGDAVKIIAKPVEASFCMQGTPVHILNIRYDQSSNANAWHR
jgi:hypothetical protein